MVLLGQAALLVALVAAAWAFLAGVLAAATRSDGLTASSGRSLVASCFLLTLSVVALVRGFLTDDFHLQYVADYSSREQPLLYKISALWGGQDGSLLLWALLLAFFASIVVWGARRVPPEFLPGVYATLGGVLVFFVAVTAFVANPLRVFPGGQAPMNGMGLNPLLQTPWMAVHPPALYLGYVGISIPFAFGAASLLMGRMDSLWIRITRRWTLFTFTFLSIGIWLGAYWAYIELGWGGFWAWDPVENASFLPWLTLTAYLHSALIQESKGTFRAWSFSLVLASFALTIFGTFLTRSGVVQSVHAFNKSSIGTWFTVFLALVVTSLGALILFRLRALTGGKKLDEIWSREGTFLLANIVLIGITAMVFVLTMWPVFSELFSGEQVTLTPEQFTLATRPFFLILLFLMGTGPLIGWRLSRLPELARRFVVPLASGLVVAVALAILGAREPWSLAYFFVSAFVIASVLVAAFDDVKTRQGATREGFLTALARQTGSHRRRYGGHIVHVSVALMAIGIAGSGSYKKDTTFEALAPGQTATLDGYQLTYQGFDVNNRPEYDGLLMKIAINRPGGGATEVVVPERRVYKRTQQPTTEVAILPTLVPRGLSELKRIGEDLYVIPVNIDLQTGRATFEVIVHPAINWLWLGGIVLMLGCHLSAWPDRKEVEDWLGESEPSAASA